MTTRRSFIYYLLTTLLVFNLGCFGSDDDPNVPDIPVIENPVIKDLAVEGAVLAQTVIEVIPEVAQGGLTTKTEGDPWFDELCGCWRWFEEDGDYDDPIQNWARGMDFAVTFYSGDTPQPGFEGADKIGLDLNYNYWLTKFGDKNYSSKSVMFNIQLEATDWAMGSVTITGSGTGEVSGGTSTGKDDWTGYFEDFGVAVNLTLPFGGCPAGSIALDLEEASFDMGFNGSPTASWTFSAEVGTPDTGSIGMTCGSN